MAQRKLHRTDLEAHVDALGQALIDTDPRTRRDMLARLDRTVVEGLRPRAVPDQSEPRSDESEDPVESRFDNLPV
ncbi:hypothetical protein [Roseivivax sediminis]|uniref:Uncharacterized protein n=1 Tax=Roseivivax sediminis TaxID=936889 RepID=A0A1I2ED28_9RHOB|nr:hypothetical protein [Roseivivax sediminis]SFE90765.1 hypothetical protein SAMN04515678_12213 [Roseivivax sediminis]